VTLAGGSAFFFSAALSNRSPETEAEELARGVSLLILIACSLMALTQIKVMGVISVGRLIAVLLVMTAANKGGLLSGAAAGAALGLAMDIAHGGTPFFTMALSFSGLLSGVFSKHGRFLFVISYILSNAVAVMWTLGSDMQTDALYEAFSAGIVFMLLPAGVIGYLGGLIRAESPARGEGALRRYSANRVKQLGEAFDDLFDAVRRNLGQDGNDNDIATVFDRAADQVCVSCKKRNECWNANYIDTLNIMNDATAAMLSGGELKSEDLPESFSDDCRHLYQFISSVNGELRGIMYRKQFKNRMSESRAAAIGQYREMAALLGGVSKDLSTAPGSDALSERRLNRYFASQDFDCSASVFRDGAGRLRAVVEGGRLGALVRDPQYLDKLSGVLGLRLCRERAGAGERRVTLLEAEPLTVSVGVAAMKKKGENVCGDKGTYFKTDQGALCVILSDGMGSGDAAAKGSAEVVAILEKFLRAGTPPATAMRILNSVMLLKNSDEWGYATADLMCVDLFTGQACFYKYGAAPSYVKNGKLIRSVRCDALATGMTVSDGASPACTRLHLKPGSLALIVSDGVLSDGDEWLKALLLEFEGSDTKQLAREALRQAVKQYGCDDDMTVLAIYVDERE
jgi:stage II sporulation protein E